MEYTNEVLQDMKAKKILYNYRFSAWYKKKYNMENGLEKDLNRGNRIHDCCSLWVWDKYEKNKLLDLKKVNRCMNSRFCSNCKMLNTSKFIHEFRLKEKELSEIYDYYLLTLTIPSKNCSGEDLRKMIDKLYKSFRKLNHKFSKPVFTPSGKISSLALSDRYVTFAGGVRVLEITYNNDHGFHPHLHCIVCVEKGSIDIDLLDKNIKGKWSRKRQSYNMKSIIDEQIGKAWTLIFNDIDFRMYSDYTYSCKEKYLKYQDENTNLLNLEVDFTPMDEGGIYEVFKYTFKNSEVNSFKVFNALTIALEYKRIRQGFGVLYDLKCDDDSEGEYQELILEIEEEPIRILTREFDELLKDFADYKKISRYNPSELVEFIKNISD